MSAYCQAQTYISASHHCYLLLFDPSKANKLQQ